MALVANATKISIPTSAIPSGFTDSAGTNLASSQPTYSNLKLSVLKATVENAVKATTFDNIRLEATVGIEKQIADKLGLEMDDTANTVTYNIDWKAVRTNQVLSEDLYNDTAESYVCTVDVYQVIS